MQVVQVYMHNMLRNFNYIVYSEKSKDAIIFDPLDIDVTLPIVKKLGLNPKYLVNTHSHYDHIQDNEKFLKIEGTKHIILANSEKLELAPGEFIQALDTPGHVMDHQCFLVHDDNRPIGLIAGDAIFNAGVGNCKNGGDVKVHYHSICHIIKNLEGSIKIYPSHDYLLNNLEFAKTIDPNDSLLDEWIERRNTQNLDHEFIITTMGEEKLINPFLKVKNEEEFINLRKLRDNW